MKNLSKNILKILGWSMKGALPGINKSVIIFAPHTSYWDGFYGKLLLMNLDIHYKFLSKKEFFKFPLNLFFKLYGSIPVYEKKEYIQQIVQLFNNHEELHIVLSPEGQLAKTRHWKKGFYYMAKHSNVPIIVGYIDYKKKEMGIKEIIYDIDDVKSVMVKIMSSYKDVHAKHPENFALDSRYA